MLGPAAATPSAVGDNADLDPGRAAFPDFALLGLRILPISLNARDDFHVISHVSLWIDAPFSCLLTP
jgi:hypothetical protein